MELLREGAKDLGLTLSPGHIDQFERYYQELRAWNQRFNLTAIIGYQEVQIKHFLDSLTCLLAFPRGAGMIRFPIRCRYRSDRARSGVWMWAVAPDSPDCPSRSCCPRPRSR